MNIEEYLSQFGPLVGIPSLDGIKYLMDKYDNPQDKLKVIHITGTNGKGSTATMMNNILINAGYNVGLFTSTIVTSLNNTITINNNPINDNTIKQILNSLSGFIDSYNVENDIKITYFEVVVALALIYFCYTKCDIAIIETGIGGLYDTTNIVNPLVSIITSISYDHADILGKSLRSIAKHKAGIIKENSNTIFIKQPFVTSIICNVCKKMNNKLFLIKKNSIKKYQYKNSIQKFNYKQYKDIELILKGKVQAYNAVLCIECSEILNSNGFNISYENIKYGLKNTSIKARLEMINNNPQIIFEDAHNISSIKNFNNSVNMYYKNYRKVFIVSLLKSKDYKKILRLLINDKKSLYILTSGINEKYINKDILYDEIKKYRHDTVILKRELFEAIRETMKNYSNYYILVVGDLCIYSEVLDYINEVNNE